MYLDESGDLGFSSRSSKHFVVVVIATREAHKLARIVRRGHRRFGAAGRSFAEIKFNSSGAQLRRYVLEGLAQTDARIVWGGVRKAPVPVGLFPEGLGLWDYVASRAISELSRRTAARSMHLTVDKFSNRLVVRMEVARRLVDETVIHHGGYFPPIVTISQIDSMKSEGLQLADFVAGAVFRSVENGDDSYLSLLGETMVCGMLYW